MSKVYTVELEVDIMADCASEAFEMAVFHLRHQRDVMSVNGICEPYCVDDPIDFEEN